MGFSLLTDIIGDMTLRSTGIVPFDSGSHAKGIIIDATWVAGYKTPDSMLVKKMRTTVS